MVTHSLLRISVFLMRENCKAAKPPFPSKNVKPRFWKEDNKTLFPSLADLQQLSKHVFTVTIQVDWNKIQNHNLSAV